MREKRIKLIVGTNLTDRKGTMREKPSLRLIYSHNEIEIEDKSLQVGG